MALGTGFLTKALSGYSFDSDSRMFFLLGSSVLELKSNRRFEPMSLPAQTFQPPVQVAGTEDRVRFPRRNSGRTAFFLLAGFVVLAMAVLVALLLFLVDRTVNTPAGEYAKFAYSNRFGFCASHGSYDLTKVGCDSLLVFSEGNWYWRERRQNDHHV